MEKTTLVLGASSNPERYSFRAVRTLQDRNIPFIAIGAIEYDTVDLKIRKGMPDDTGPVHTVTMYLNPKNQEQYYSYVLSLNPRRVIFNPGTTNNLFAEILKAKGIEVVNDCMLVMLHCGKF